jgi:hypothetical protein
MQIINVPINLDKYSLLKNINEEYLPYILDDIINNGYNIWVKNFINNEITTDFNNITQNKLSSTKGQIGENVVQDILVEKFQDFQIENTSKIPHSGDIQVTFPSKNKIIIEVKNYNKTIDQEQLDKLRFDMKFSNIYFAIFISLNSGIVGKKRFDLETFYYNKQNYYILYLPYSMHKTIPNRKYIITHNSIEDSIYNLTLKIEFGICIMQSISDKFLKNNNKQSINTDIDYLIQEFNNFYEEFRTIKNSCTKLEDNIKKSVESHINVIKDFEFSIKNNINKLINKKINIKLLTNSTNYEIKNSNYANNWDIFINNILVGKIIKFKIYYDLLLKHNDVTINEIFTEFIECVEFLDNL